MGLVNKYIKYLNISSILLLINNIKFLFYLKNNKTYSYLPLILLNFFGAPKGVPKDIEPFFDLTLSILILLLIVLSCFVRIVSYFYTVYLIDKYNLYLIIFIIIYLIVIYYILLNLYMFI